MGEPAAIAAIIERITERRRRADDPDRHLLPDDAAGCVHYVRTHRRVPPEIMAADVLDGLAITRLQRERVETDELGLIRIGRTMPRPITWEALAGPMKLGSRQGAEARFRRLEAATAGDGRNDRIGREARSVRRQRVLWMIEHRAEVHNVCAQAFAVAHELPEEYRPEACALYEIGDMVSRAVALRLLLADLDGEDLPGQAAAWFVKARDAIADMP